ncbi:MAG: hypothetical protein KGL26_01035, partial [Pseudomonadota bacterium]|nr:hypothetical protein [Pseudomonadota bacterium]
MNERTMAEEIEEEVMLRSYPDRPCAFATTGEPYALIGIDGRRAPGEYCGFTTSLALAVAALKQAIHAYIRDVTKGETAGWRILWRVAPTIESHEIEIKVGDDDTLVLDGIEKTPRALHRKQQVYTGRARLLVTNLPPRFDLNGDPLDSDARAACGLPPLTREQADATIGAFLRQIKEDADWRAERERGVAEAQRLLRAGPSEALHDAARFQGFPGYKITETYGFDARRA